MTLLATCPGCRRSITECWCPTPLNIIGQCRGCGNSIAACTCFRDVNIKLNITPEMIEAMENMKPSQTPSEMVNHPNHYGGADNPYEAIKVIEAWELGFNTGNAVKYISRAGKKNPNKTIEDLQKAKWYIEREISRLSEK